MHVESIAIAKADRNHAAGLGPMHDARTPFGPAARSMPAPQSA
ncbi:hypothetical protein [Gluconacetobacter tumulicola]|nr:hypothetical protein [Gluconacetobacter tumulicola]